MNTPRRFALKKILASVAGTVGLGFLANAANTGDAGKNGTAKEKEVFNVVDDQEVPLFSGATKFNGLVFIAGKGAHFEGDIKSHTDHVLKELEKELAGAGSSMEKVLKVNVYLNDIEDYKGMNEVFLGRFGKKPPVRTTVAVAKGGVPGNSLVEMDCIAFV
jgi:2-iminobutanoate/2-iminopropanoate deaminase